MLRVYRKFLFISVLILAAIACNFGVGGSGDSVEGGGDPEILFSDDFSNPSSGWDRVSDSTAITDYDNGAYRIYVNESNYDVWANPGRSFTDVQVEVTATKVGGSDDNDFGLICRYRDVENYYFFIISSDGFYAIGLVENGAQQLIGTESMDFSEKINQGGTSNLIRADCVGDTLTLYANGSLLADVRDTRFTSGDVGLIAGTFDEPGTDIRFTNFVVRNPQ